MYSMYSGHPPWLSRLVCAAAALSLLNWTTACCCGSSRLVTSSGGPAEQADHEHHAELSSKAHHHHYGPEPIRAPHRCHKKGCDWSGASLDLDAAPLASAGIHAATPPDALSPPLTEMRPDTTGRERPRAGPPPPALYLRHEQLLI